jgi:hypothetical protein
MKPETGRNENSITWIYNLIHSDDQTQQKDKNIIINRFGFMVQQYFSYIMTVSYGSTIFQLHSDGKLWFNNISVI